MAGAADLVIAEVNEIVEVGEIDPTWWERRASWWTIS